ncbi:Retinoblastoma-binding protein [Coemansia sp. RSA 552]|nr:Retinoblastoma-binding protein [Coemansia sp. RSA 552]
MSQIQYKFRSSKEYSNIVFDGLSIPVADLKQEILREQKLNPDDFDLVITNEQTNEDYKDDTALIQKNTVVLVRRIPYTGPKMSRMVANNYRQQQYQGMPGPGYAGGPQFGAGGRRGAGPPASGPGSQFGYRGPQGVGINAQRNGRGPPLPGDGSEMDTAPDAANNPEDAGIAAMLAQSDDQWQHQQSVMEMQRPVFPGRGGFRGRPGFPRPEHRDPPPPNYVCHRCGVQGHWIDCCPTINNPHDGNGKQTTHRVKRTTGIPKSFLQKVDNLDEVGNALVTSDGTLVVATANEAAWNSAQRLTGNAISAVDAIDPNLIPAELKCNICKNLAKDAVTTPCCKTVFCSACIESQLLNPGDMHFTCPACNTKNVVPDQLETATETRGKVDEFLREYSSRQNAPAPEAEAKADPAKPTASNGAASGTAPPPSTAAAPAAPAPTSAANVPRPPIQMQPRPRQPMSMMMGGFPGIMGMGMPFMAPGMMPRPPPGMMPPGMWNGGMPIQQQMPPPGGAPNSGSRSGSRSSTRGERSRSRARSRHDTDDDIDMRDAPSDERSRGSDKGRSRSGRDRDRDHRRRDDSRSRRDRSRDSRTRRSHRSRERDHSRRPRDDRGSSRSRRDDDRQRDHSGRRERRPDRSRSPGRHERSSHGSRRSEGRGRDSKPAELSIRGQSGSTAGARSIADRLTDNRQDSSSGSGSRRRRNHRR